MVIDGMDDEYGIEISAEAGSPDDAAFDEVVGALQETLLDPQFTKLQTEFLNKHCMQFEASEENKLCYTSIFQDYQKTIEGYLEAKLHEAIESFSMETFMGQLESRKDQIDEPLMDLLLSFSEFE